MVAACSATTCYQCVYMSTTGDTASCEKAGSTASTQTGCDFCTVTKTSFNDIKQVARQCVNSGTAPGNECNDYTLGDYSGTICYCDADLCNGDGNGNGAPTVARGVAFVVMA